MNIQELQNLCHQRAKDAGWWGDGMTADLPNVGEKICLIHSEISEAVKGYQENLMDDKLPSRPMMEVELADARIHLLDLAGYLNLNLQGVVESIVETEFEPHLSCISIDRDFNNLHLLITEGMEGYRKGLLTVETGETILVMELNFAKFLILSEKLADLMDMDLESATKEKMEFNLNREDHKLENRAKDGGKKF